MSLPRVILKPRRAQPFFGRHPWVYAGAVAAVTGEPADGAEVDLYSQAANFVARGLYNGQSKIRVRLYSWSHEAPLDDAFFRQRLKSAARFRQEILKLGGPEQACRLVFSEADGLSGLIVDRYGAWLVVQFTALALALRKQMYVDSLVELFQPKGIYLRTERGIGKLEGLELQDGLLWGEEPSAPISIEETGIRFLVNLKEGQKTGFYMDQRDNRQAVARLAQGRSVLDGFCYTGGFALHAARAGAAEVLGLDASESALALARENARLNCLERVEFIAADVFDELARLAAAGRKFDMVILDPPKFARAQHAVPEALQGYRRLQTLALRLLAPDGILVMCCCSGLIAFAMLEETLAQVSAKAGREIQILERRGQAPDHPVAVSCPESNYLKCLICRVT
ncbi:MAG TPA: class I SAM-dependent rRNA methyltransferase [Gemmataceae bacterium]|jgi:23S rRNA (cytosine1962-C5)-methyltransferase|nr:class I SAM-dependent rRNA methyltransferase [Gemmataceae bacterium]